MSLETLIQAARYVEMQEQKQKQATPPKPPSNPVPVPPPITVTTPIRIKQESVVTTASTTTQPTIQIQAAPHQILRNSFDIINPLVIDEGGEAKRKQPPLVFRSGTREVHNKLEKHRRAHLKECFDVLKKQLPGTSEEKKASNLNILHSAINYIQKLKKCEVELEHEMERLAREKIAYQQKLALLKKDLPLHSDFNFSSMLPDTTVAPTDAPSPLSTASSGGGGPPQIQIHENLIIKEESVEEPTKQQPTMIAIAPKTTVVTTASSGAPAVVGISPEIQVSIGGNELKPTKSITRAVPVVTTSAVNGIKEQTVMPQTTQVQTTALSVLPIGYPMNQGLVLQKVIVPKGITDLSQLVSSPPVAHFITPQQLNGKVVPLVNAQYVVKPLVVVSTPSRPS